MQDPVSVMMVYMCQPAALGPKSKGSWTPALLVPQVQVPNSSQQNSLLAEPTSIQIPSPPPPWDAKYPGSV